MLSTLFFLFLALALVLTIFGFVSDISVFNLTGTILLFLLGLTLLNGGLTYKIGENVTTTIDASNVSVSESVDVYGHYDDAGGNRYGWFLLILGVLAFILSLFML